jgi:hypothetical protein
MASSVSTMTEVVLQRVRTKYHWPPIQLNFWILIMLVGSATILGINAYFITVQKQLEVGIPWYVFLLLQHQQRFLDPPQQFSYYFPRYSVFADHL